MKTIIELKSKRWQSLILLPFILLIVWAFYWFIFDGGLDPEQPPPATLLKAVAIIAICLGSLLFLYFLKMTIIPVTILKVDESGFIQNTGTNTGFIKWEEVDRMIMKTIPVSTSNGIQSVPVIAIHMKDPQKFRKRYNLFLRKALVANEKLRGETFYIPYAYVAANFESFKEIVVRKCGQLEIEN